MTFQREALEWAEETFGPGVKDPEERAKRFIEEALELVHAIGLHSDQVHGIFLRVYGNGRGNVAKELGQTQLTLGVLAEVLCYCSLTEGSRELERVKRVPKEDFQQRHLAKVYQGIAK